MTMNPYRERIGESVLCADPLELVVMLYSGLNDSIGEARRCLARGDIRTRAEALSRALEILGELAASLDRERGGEIAANLAVLYDFMADRLQLGNSRQQDQPLAEAARVAATLLEAWREVRPAVEPMDVPPARLAAYDRTELSSLSFCG